MVEFTNSVSDKRNEYFKKTLNVPLENITYRNLSVKSDQSLEHFLYEKDSDNDEKETD